MVSRGRTEVTGLPIREEFFAVPAKRRRARLTILITGGSQGSRTLNRAVEESWPLWKRGSVRLLHQTGAAMYDELAPGFGRAESRENHGLHNGYAAGVRRSGSRGEPSGMGAVSELAAAGKPSILVPLPGASDQHQLRNAEALAAAGAARLVLDDEMNGARSGERSVRILIGSSPALWRE